MLMEMLAKPVSYISRSWRREVTAAIGNISTILPQYRRGGISPGVANTPAYFQFFKYFQDLAKPLQRLGSPLFRKSQLKKELFPGKRGKSMNFLVIEGRNAISVANKPENSNLKSRVNKNETFTKTLSDDHFVMQSSLHLNQLLWSFWMSHK